MENIKTAGDFISNVLNKEFFPVQIDNDFKVGHGHTLSVKIVMPCYCQANCPFCFNKQTSETQVHDTRAFFKNMKDSLEELFANIHDRRISLDITGNEPTFNVKEFVELMNMLAYFKERYKEKVDKIVLTTNGYHLNECMIYMKDIVDIVNISVHHYEYLKRTSEIFRTKYIPSNEDLKNLNKELHERGFATTSIAVIYEPFESYLDYVLFVLKFVDFSKDCGFDNTRIRLDFCDETGEMNKIFNEYKFEEEIVQEQSGLATKILKRHGFEIRIYKGVKDLVDYVIGVEMVVDDDGKLYLDYNKRYCLNGEEYWHTFNDFIYVIKQ